MLSIKALLSNKKKDHVMGGEIFFLCFIFNMFIYLFSKILTNKGEGILTGKKIEIMIL